MLRAIGERLRGARYFVADLFFVVARFPRALAQGVTEFWRSLPIMARRRLGAALGAAVALLLVAGVIVPNLPCGAPGGDECPPADDAIELAPAASVAYLHANIDPDTEQAERAADVVARLPLVSEQLIGRALAAFGGSTAQVALDATAEPWFGGEMAASVLGSGAELEQVLMLEAGDTKAALEFVETRGAGQLESDEYRGLEIREDPRGLASAAVEGFLVLGTADGVRAIVDAATGAQGAGSLADDEDARDAMEALPDHRVAEAYLSADAIETLVADPRASLGAFEPLVDVGASRGAALAVSADSDGIELATRSVLDPDSSGTEPGFFAAFEEFEPQLVSELAPDSLLYVGLGSPQETLEALLGQATVGAPGIAAGVTDLIADLRSAADVDLQRDLLQAIGGEAAFSVVPRAPGADGGGAGGSAQGATPYLEFLADEVDEGAAREALARLQDPIARQFDRELAAPNFSRQSFGDVDAEVLSISPIAQLAYAVADSVLVIANDLAAIERLAEDGGDGLADSERYRESMDELPDDVALAAYLDLRGLLAFAESGGLAADTAYTAFASDLRRLDSLGVAVSRDDDVLAGDARLLID